jgi:hypothetical protein
MAPSGLLGPLASGESTMIDFLLSLFLGPRDGWGA